MGETLERLRHMRHVACEASDKCIDCFLWVSWFALFVVAGGRLSCPMRSFYMVVLYNLTMRAVCAKDLSYLNQVVF